MAARSVWKGFITFGLVAVPVKAYTASNSGGTSIALNQLHKDCNNRINYRKTCPVHGEIPSSEIVSGYEFSPGQYVIIDPEEIEKLRPAKEKSINVAAFIRPDTLDSNYYSGKNYYLLPDGPVASKPYALMRKVMQDTGRYAFAQMVFLRREQVVMVRPVDNMMVMTVLSYDTEVRKPSEFEGEAPKVEVAPEELKLARTLIETLAVDDFDFAQYKDKYADRLRELIELKVAGKEVAAQPEEAPPPVINLMEALQKSLDQAKKSAKPPKLAAPGTAATKAAGARKRKQA